MIEELPLYGCCTLYAWPGGRIPSLVKSGFSYPQAKKICLQERWLVDRVKAGNLIVTVGKGLVGDLLIDAETAGLSIHAIGTGTSAPLVGDTALTTEVKRKLWTTRLRTLGVITLDAFYLASESTYFIKECGTFGGATASITPGSGKLFSHWLLSYDNSAGANDLTLEWQLTIG